MMPPPTFLFSLREGFNFILSSNTFLSHTKSCADICGFRARFSLFSLTSAYNAQAVPSSELVTSLVFGMLNNAVNVLSDCAGMDRLVIRSKRLSVKSTSLNSMGDCGSKRMTDDSMIVH
ncbi:hypothetical protein BDR06DRAFT_189290 [Suillus hirtellus]|nr:hypothetical protein BDR06DRAFT_189290 [Suillus hirtellus]